MRPVRIDSYSEIDANYNLWEFTQINLMRMLVLVWEV